MRKLHKQNGIRGYAMLIFCSLIIYAAHGQQMAKSNLSSPDDHLPGFMSPGGLLDTVFDRFGYKYSLRQIVINDEIRGSGNAVAVGLNNAKAKNIKSTFCSSGYFQLYLEDGCGFENYASDPVHAARLTVICQVLKDISSFINSPLSAPGSPKINIWVRNPANINPPSTFLGVASSFFNLPYAPASTGIVDNTVWLTMLSGKDAYTNVLNPVMNGAALYSSNTGSMFHGFTAFNFNNISWHTDLTTSPSSNEYDLYSVALHEFMHALGFASLISNTGASLLGTNFQYYTRYDINLKANTGASLIVSTGSCNVYNYSFNSTLNASSVLSPDPAHHYTDSTVCTNAIKYNDGIMSVPVYTPNAWEAGSSLSHFEDECLTPDQNNQYFVMSNARVPGPYNSISNPGAMTRYPKHEERQALCDIGYNVNTTFGNAVNLNNNNYGGTSCNGLQIAGINDGIDNFGGYTYVSTGGTVTINGSGVTGLLANDFNANSFSCLEIVIGPTGGSLNATSGTSATTVTYTPPSGFTGPVLLRYIPQNTVTGSYGNITYVYVWVNGGNCVASACDMVMNPGFENAVGCGSIDDLNYPGNHINCWSEFINTPDTWSTLNNCSNISTHPGVSNNTRFLGLWSRLNSNGSFLCEAVQSTLVAPLITGKTYKIGFWARINIPFTGYNFGYTPSTVLLGLSANPMVGSGGTFTAFPSGITTLKTYVVTDSIWRYHTDTFTYTGAAMSNFIVSGNPSLDPSTSAHDTYLCLDDISIEPINNIAFLTLPDSITTCTIIPDLSIYASVPGGVFSGPGVSVSNGIYSFSAHNAFNGSPGLATITYTYTDQSGCTHNIFSQMQVIVSSTCCDPYIVFPNQSFTVLNPPSGQINTNLSAGNYTLNSSVTISGNITFTNAVIAIASGVTITITSGSKLTLNGCHLYSCGSNIMWNGIVVSGSGQLYMNNNTLIEDAVTAVYANNPPTPASGYVISADGAVFNRNATGIDIENYTANITNYPFQIRNTVFTSRLFIGLGGLKNSYTPSNSYLPPYNIDNPQAWGAIPPFVPGMPFIPTDCKIASPVKTGVKLYNVGFTVGKGISYREIMIGDATTSSQNTYLNLFDNLTYGVSSTNSNVSCINNVFMYMKKSSVSKSGGDGIYAASAISSSTHDTLKRRLQIYQSNSYTNYFYNCYNGVEVNNYYKIIGQNAYMISTHDTFVTGNYGYKLLSWDNDSVSISNNTIINITNGIYFSTNYYNWKIPGTTILQAQFPNLGPVVASSNTISANISGTPTSSQFVSNAITLQNVLFPSSCISANPCNPVRGQINVDNNSISNAFNGININNFWAQVATSNSNVITIRPNQGIPIQCGIRHTLCKNDIIYNNNIQGSPSTITDNCRAVLCETGDHVSVRCNSESNIGRGFEFAGGQANSSWRYNNMQNNLKGFLLTYNGLIGVQGSATDLIDNSWLGSWSTSHWQTYALNSVAMASTLNVRSGVTTDPQFNGGAPSGFFYAHGVGGGIYNHASSAYLVNPCGYPSGGFVGVVGGYTDIVTNMATFTQNQNLNEWMSQYSTWRAMLIDSTMVDSSAIMQDFQNLAFNSRYKYLTDIENYLTNGDEQDAQLLINNVAAAQPTGYAYGQTGAVVTDLPDGNIVVNNSLTFYNLYMRYQDSVMTNADSTALTNLASLCPNANGAVIYQARALYNLVYDTIAIWNDSACAPDPGTDGGGGGGTVSKGNNLSLKNIKDASQNYRLFPNPNEGNITLLQTREDNEPVRAEVKNIIGQSIYEGQLRFKNYIAQLNLTKATPGVYILLLTDSSGQAYPLRFVIK